jgi:hypothetical protein
VHSSVLLPSLGAAEAAGVITVVATKEAEVRSGKLRVRARVTEPPWRELRSATAGPLNVLVISASAHPRSSASWPAMSRQPDKYSCVETLVHETQRLKLCALLDLVALLQGAYAFLGVSGFWREQRQTAPEPKVRQRAHVEFARWREGGATAAATLLDSGQLTSAGETFVQAMGEVLDEWRHEPVPSDALDVARRKSDRHLAQWQARNGQADTG